MPEPETLTKKQNWRFTSLKNLRAAPRSFLCHPAPRASGSFVRGEQLLAYQFVFAGQKVVAEDASIWNIRPPSQTFFDELHSFSWLDDLAAIGDGAARKRAQAWLLEWIDAFGQGSGIGWHPALAGRRLVSWCSHAMFLLKGLPPKASAAVFKNLGRQVGFLSLNWKATPQGLPQVEALTGMVYAGLALEGCEYALRPALKGLGAACGWIGADGAIPNRNPEELSEIFTRLTWVAKLLETCGHPADPEILAALARIAPGLRALRFGDGSLARFHGGGRGVEGRLDQALADAHIRTVAAQTRFMGYERLAAGRLVVVMDAAAPPASANAHASQLGFEIAAGRWPLLANCGPGARLGGAWASACAHSAAHNTLTVEGQTATRAKVGCARAQDLDGVWLSATSHGFVAAFDLLLERRLLITSNGRQLSGEDRLYPATPPKPDPHPAALLAHPLRGHSYMLHFHLHPDVTARRDDHAITLTLPNAETWVFRQEGGLLCLEDSVMLDRTHTEPRATKQIVVAGRTIDYVGAIRWSFTKT